MNSWQLQEYNELRLEKISEEYSKYYWNHLKNIIKSLYFENSVERPKYSGYDICPCSEDYDKKLSIVTGEFEYRDNEDIHRSEYYTVPAEWFSMPLEKVKNEIVKMHIESYTNKQKFEEQQRELRKQREIEALEEQLKLLKGQQK